MDGGVVSKRGTLEKDINLSISPKLTENEYIVVMTKDEDKGLCTLKNSAEK